MARDAKTSGGRMTEDLMPDAELHRLLRYIVQTGWDARGRPIWSRIPSVDFNGEPCSTRGESQSLGSLGQVAAPQPAESPATLD